jgi:hypothetical protein
MTRRLLGIVFAMVFVAGVDDARAQEDGFTITVRENGQPVANATLAVVLNGIKRPTEANSSESGEMVVAGVGIEPGTPTELYVRRCVDGEIELVAVPRGEPAEVACADEDAEVEEGCTCRKLALILLWGRDAEVEISDTATSQDSSGPLEGRPNVTIGFKVDALTWTRLEEVCGEDAGASCDADGTSSLVGGFAEVSVTRSLVAGVSAFYAGPVEFRQTFNNGTATDGEMTSVIVDLYGGGRWHLSPRVALLGLLGWSWIRNDAEFNSIDGTLDKDESGGRARIGAALDALLSDRMGLRLNLDFRTGGSDDADTSVAAGGGLVIRLGDAKEVTR